MEQLSANKRREFVATLVVLLVVAGVVTAAGVSAHRRKVVSTAASIVQTTQPAKTSSSASGATSNTSNSPPATPTYKDGTYAATGSYDSPGGFEQITVTVTIKSDVITGTSAQSGANDPEASEYQSQFISGYKQLVVGKDISSLRLNRVAGSSLTSQGFNNAISQIKQQAKQS
ncbi:MAG TPA: hypothetical protein VLH84_05435 [Patescibacteria group bacterium]|nr:hypothetical protein [Patescibacteria group bacterium]